MSKLLSNYETRIKNFVLKMSESPYLIKKYHSIYTPKNLSPIPVTQTFIKKMLSVSRSINQTEKG